MPFKFAFSDQDKGVVEVGLHQQNDEVTIKVADDGKGLPEDFDLETTKTLGMKLINVLVRQLKLI